MSNWDFGGGSAGSSGLDDVAAAPAASATSWTQGAGPAGPGPAADGGSASPAASAPMLWIMLGVLASTVAIVVHLLAKGVGPAVATWVLAGPVAIGLLGVFTAQDTKRRSNPWYADTEVSAWGRRILVGLSLVGVGLSAWTIADWITRR